MAVESPCGLSLRVVLGVVVLGAEVKETMVHAVSAMDLPKGTRQVVIH